MVHVSICFAEWSPHSVGSRFVGLCGARHKRLEIPENRNPNENRNGVTVIVRIHTIEIYGMR